MSFSRQIAASDINSLAPLTFSASIATTQIQSIQINGAYSGANLFNRAIQDASTFTSTTTGAYASFDANPTMNGATAYNHFYGFEARNIYAGTGGLTTAASFISNGFQFNGSGTIAAFRHFDLTDAAVSGPTLTEQSGLYIPNLTTGSNIYGLNLNVVSGANKYNIYVNGTAVNYFNGQVETHAGQKWSGGFIDVTALNPRFNLAVDTNITFSGTGTLATINSLNDAGNTYEPLFFNSSVAVWNVSGTEKFRVGASLVQFGGTTALFPALKRSSTTLQGRLGDDSAFAPVQAKLTTDTNATTGLVAGALSATTNASIVLYDGSGQAYRVPCII